MGPGLIGSLLVGVNVARGIAAATGLPLIGVNHIEGHIYANWLTDVAAAEPLPAEPPFPLLCLVVSGGHTQLVLMEDHGRYRLLGQTVDDAAGEAFDKVGRLLGLPYPGGPGHLGGRRGGARRRPLPAGADRWPLRLQLLRPEDRRAARGGGLPGAQRADPGRRPGGRLRGGGGRCPGPQDGGRGDRPWRGRRGAGRRRGRQPRAALDAARAPGGARPAAACPAAGLVHGQRRHDRRRGRLPLRCGRPCQPRRWRRSRTWRCPGWRRDRSARAGAADTPDARPAAPPAGGGEAPAARGR